MFLVVGLKISKPVNTAFFTGSEPVKNPVKWEFAWQLHACCHIPTNPPPPPTKKYNVEV